MILWCQYCPVRVQSSGLRFFSYVNMWSEGAGSNATGMGKRLSLRSKKEKLRTSSRIVRGFQKVSETEPKWGVPAQLTVFPPLPR